jgi:hypothetical protein
MEPALLQATDDRPPSHAEVKQLLTRHDRVLPTSQSRHLPLKKSSGQLSTNMVPN